MYCLGFTVIKSVMTVLRSKTSRMFYAINVVKTRYGHSMTEEVNTLPKHVRDAIRSVYADEWFAYKETYKIY